MKRRITCEQANQVDLVDYLERLGHIPKKIRNNDYWYLSPLRDEKTPSFKVNRKLNLWYDHGLGKGGNLVDFGILYYKCSVKELLYKLENQNEIGFSFHPQSAGEKKENNQQQEKIIITATRGITDPSLRDYLNQRQIPLFIAERVCVELDFTLYGKKHTSLGFKNNAGGYELRNEYFKGSSSPKDITLLENGSNQLSVFEGYFSFLSFQTLQLPNKKSLIELPKTQTSFLILNSLSFFQKSRELWKDTRRFTYIWIVIKQVYNRPRRR